MHWKRREILNIPIAKQVNLTSWRIINNKHTQVNPYKKEPDFIRVNPLGLVPVSFCLTANPLPGIPRSDDI